jgi:4-aminobutyrate aminotransferase
MTQWDHPRISIRPPGPKAKAVIELDESFTSPSYTRPYPFVAESGRGVYLADPDGNVYLDFNAGIAVCATGHGPTQVTQAVIEQAEKFLHYCGADFYYGPQAELAARLCETVSGSEPWRVVFTNSGAESIEAAIKLARYSTKRQKFIAFIGGFHGRTMGALAFTASKSTQRALFAPMMPGVTHVPYAYCYRCPYHMEPETCAVDCVSFIEEVLFKQTMEPAEVAAVVVEPIQGEAGYIVPPAKFHQELWALCRRHNILLVADEVQTGVGRTGRMLAMEHFDVQPDIITMAKGLASGMVLGATLARADIMTWKPGSQGSTFGGNPVSCVAALATLELVKEKLMENARETGAYLKERLERMQPSHRLMGDVRGLGLMAAVEMVRDRETKEEATEEVNRILRLCFERGLLLLACGRNTVRFCPPLVVTKKQVDQALEIFETVLAEVETGD